MSVQEQQTNYQDTEDVLQYEVDNGVATIWLNRPHKKNCINWALLMELGAAFDRAITLPVEIDADAVQAECRDGLLALLLPRAAKDRPRAVQVT